MEKVREDEKRFEGFLDRLRDAVRRKDVAAAHEADSAVILDEMETRISAETLRFMS